MFNIISKITWSSIFAFVFLGIIIGIISVNNIFIFIFIGITLLIFIFVLYVYQYKNILINIFIILLFFAPPFLQELEYVARGLKIDQLLLYVLFIIIIFVYPQKIIIIFKQNNILKYLLVFSISAFITVLTSSLLFRDFSFVKGTINFLGQFRILILIITTLFLLNNKDVNENNIINLMIFCGFIVILIGILQYLKIPIIYNLTTTLYTRKSGMDAVILAINAGRVYGTFDGQANTFGTFTIIESILALSMYYQNVKAKTHKKYFYILAFFISIIGLLFSGSRGAYAGFLIAILFFLIINYRYLIKNIFFLTIYLALSYMLIPEWIKNRIYMLFTLQGYNGETIYENRLPYWFGNLKIFSYNPLFGVKGVPMYPPDSLYFGLLTGNGIIGLVIFMMLLFYIIHLLNKFRHINSKIKYVNLGLISIILGMMVNGISIPSFFVERVQEIFWLLFSLIYSLNLKELRGNSNEKIKSFTYNS
jgi:hypothetical protein